VEYTSIISVDHSSVSTPMRETEVNIINISDSPVSEFDESITSGECDFGAVFRIDILFWVSLDFLGVLSLFVFNL